MGKQRGKAAAPGLASAPGERPETRRRFWETVDRIRARNADRNPAEELDFVTRVVEDARRERHGEAEDQTEGGR